MGRRTYSSLDDLITDLDHEGIEDEEEFLEDEDLALLQTPRVAPVKQPPKKARKPAKKPKAKKNGKK